MQPELRQFIWITILFSLFGAISGLGIAFVWPPTYVSEFHLQVTSTDLSGSGASAMQSAEALVLRAKAVADSLNSTALAARAARRLGRDKTYAETLASNVKVKADAALIKVRVSNRSASEATREANFLLEERIAQEKERTAGALAPLVSGIAEQMKVLRNELEQVNTAIAGHPDWKMSLEDKKLAAAPLSALEAALAQVISDEQVNKVKTQRLSELVAKLDTLRADKQVPEIPSFGDENYNFSAVRAQLLTETSNLVSLQRRYGERSPQVGVAEARVQAAATGLANGLRDVGFQLTIKDSGLTASRQAIEALLNSVKQESVGTASQDPVYLRLESNKRALENAYQNLLLRHQDVSIADRVGPRTLSVVDPPTFPSHPSRLIPAVIIAASFAFWTGLGITIACLRSTLLRRAFVSRFLG